MTTAITTFLSSLRFGESQFQDNLAMVPVFSDQTITQKYITLEEGIASSLLNVEELEGGASVNDILLRNKSNEFALLFEGEELLGAMQNRILDVSILVKPNTKQILPVACVEAGRWHYENREEDLDDNHGDISERDDTDDTIVLMNPAPRQSNVDKDEQSKRQRFSVANRVHYARGRALQSDAVSSNLSTRREFRGNQSAVWSDISNKSRRMDTTSKTSASDAMYVSADTTMRKYVKYFKHSKKQIGSVFLVDGAVAGVEIFANGKTHRRMLPRLIRSYALDAIDSIRGKTRPKYHPAKVNSVTKAKRFIEQLQGSWVKEFDGVCLGKNVRFQDQELTGGALVHNDQVLHISALVNDRN